MGRPRPWGDRGAAAVELALILPVLLLLIGGIVDFGRAFFAQIIITNAASEGARAGVVQGGSRSTGERRRRPGPRLGQPTNGRRHLHHHGHHAGVRCRSV